MIKMQIVETTGANLHSTLLKAIRTGDLRTFNAEKCGRKVTRNTDPGWMNWSANKGVIVCDILSPQKPDMEWKFLRDFVGRLADRYSKKVHSIAIQFQAPVSD